MSKINVPKEAQETNRINVPKEAQEAIINSLYSRLIKEDINLSQQALDYIKNNIDLSSIAQDVFNLVQIPDPIPGKDGIDGKDGEDGLRGRDGESGEDYRLTDENISTIIETILSKIPEPIPYVLTDDDNASIIKSLIPQIPGPIPYILTEDDLKNILNGISPYFTKILKKAIKDLIFKIERGQIDLPILGGGGLANEALIREINRVLGSDQWQSHGEHTFIEDQHIYINAGYTETTVVNPAIVFNYLPTSTADQSLSFVAGEDSVSNPYINTVGSDTFSTNDIIQVSGDGDNNGLYEVLDHTGTVLTIRGIGLTATVEGFTDNQFEDESRDSVITKVNVAVMQIGDDGEFEIGKGSETSFTFTDIDHGGTATWGNIDGTLSNQTDLQLVLDSKIDWDQDIDEMHVPYFYEDMLQSTNATVNPDNMSWTFAHNISLDGSHINMSNAVSLSEDSQSLFITDRIDGVHSSIVSSTFDSEGTNNPSVFWGESETTIEIQSISTTTITTNPLSYTFTVDESTYEEGYRVHSMTIQSGLAMDNFKFTVTDEDTGIGIRYAPSQYIVGLATDGYDIIKVGDITFDLINPGVDDPTNGLFYMPGVPIMLRHGHEYTIEFEGDNISMLGNSSSEPYISFEASIGYGRNIAFKDHTDRSQTTGWLSGGYLTQSSSTTVSWTAGDGQIVDFSDPDHPELDDPIWNAVISYTPSTLAIDNTTILGYDATATKDNPGTGTHALHEILSTDLTSLDLKNYVLFGAIIHESGAIVDVLNTPFNIGYGVSSSFADFIHEIIGPATKNGNTYSPNSTNVMKIDVTGGEVYVRGANAHTDPKNPDTPVLGTETNITHFTCLREPDPSNSVNFYTITDTIDPDYYDLDGVLTEMPNNYWQIKRIFRVGDGKTVVAYGQVVFQKYSDAIAALGSEYFEEKAPLPMTLSRCSLVIVEGCDDLTDTDQAVFFKHPSFRQEGVSGTTTSIPGVTSPAGVLGSIQYYATGDVFGGTDDFIFDTSTNRMSIGDSEGNYLTNLSIYQGSTQAYRGITWTGEAVTGDDSTIGVTAQLSTNVEDEMRLLFIQNSDIGSVSKPGITFELGSYLPSIAAHMGSDVLHSNINFGHGDTNVGIGFDPSDDPTDITHKLTVKGDAYFYDDLTIDNIYAEHLFVYNSIAAGPFGGFGYHQNYITYSEDLSNWSDPLSKTTILSSTETAPNDTDTMYQIQWNSTGLGLRLTGLSSFTSGETYILSFWGQLTDGDGNLTFDIGDGSGSSEEITSSIKRHIVTLTAGSSSWLDITKTSSVGTFNLWGFQINDGEYAYPYLHTKGTAHNTGSFGSVTSGDHWNEGDIFVYDGDITIDQGRIIAYGNGITTNFAAGESAFNSATTAYHATVTGYNSGNSISSGAHNTLYGSYTGATLSGTSGNSYFGALAGQYSTGSLGLFLGFKAGQSETGSNKLHIANNETTSLIEGSFSGDWLYFRGDTTITSGYDFEIAGGQLISPGPSAGSWNFAAGEGSLISATTAGLTTSTGYRTGEYITTGHNNTLYGCYAGNSLTTEGNNTFLGTSSGQTATTEGSVFIGYRSGRTETVDNKLHIANTYDESLIEGSFEDGWINILSDTTILEGNIIAYGAGGLTTNFAGGLNSLAADIAGGYNVAIGYNSFPVSTATGNVGVGADTGLLNTTGYSNTFAGNAAGRANTTGNFSSYFGSAAGYYGSGDYNTHVGAQSGFNYAGEYTTTLGALSGYSSTGDRGVYIGYESGYSENQDDMLIIANNQTTSLIEGSFSGYWVNIMGNLATQTGSITANSGDIEVVDGYLLSHGGNNILSNTAIGSNALGAISTGTNSTAAGRNALWQQTTGSNNSGFGSSVGYTLTTQSSNSFFGSYSGYYCEGGNNIFAGANSGRYQVGGSFNTFLGSSSGSGTSSTSLYRTTAIGYQSMNNNSSSGWATAIGMYAGASSTGTDGVYLGYSAGRNETEDHKLWIANNNSALVEGSFADSWLKIYDSLIVGNTGGRGKIQNKIPYSENLSQWTNIAATIDSTSEEDPDGFETATEFSHSGSVGTVLRAENLDLTTATTYIVSFWVKWVSGDTGFRINLANGQDTGILTATTDWTFYRFELIAGSAEYVDIQCWNNGTKLATKIQVVESEYPYPYLKTDGEAWNVESYGAIVNGDLAVSNDLHVKDHFYSESAHVSRHIEAFGGIFGPMTNYRGWDIRGLYHRESGSVISNPYRQFWQDDGYRVFVTRSIDNYVRSYDCDDPFNLDTMSISATSTSTIPTTATMFTFSHDGKQMYAGAANNLRYYLLENAWDITDFSHVGTIDLSAYDTGMTAIQWSHDGSKFWTWGIDNQKVYQFSCEEDFNISTWSKDSDEYDFTGEVGSSFVVGGSIRSDGKKMIIHSYGFVDEFELVVADDITTCSHLQQLTISVLQQGGAIFEHGRYFFTTHTSGTNLYKYEFAPASTEYVFPTDTFAWEIGVTASDQLSISRRPEDVNDSAERYLSFDYDSTNPYMHIRCNILSPGMGALDASNLTYGWRNLQNNVSGSHNLAVGTEALLALTTAHSNTALGHNSLGTLTIGNSNIAIGSYAGFSVGDASGGLYIGNYAGYLTDEEDYLFIGNSDASTGATIIEGNMDNRFLNFRSTVEADGLMMDRVIHYERWPGGTGDLVGDLGTWTEENGGSGSSYVDPPDNSNFQWCQTQSATDWRLTSPAIDLTDYVPFVFGSGAGDTETRTMTRVMVKGWINTDSMDSASEYLAIDIWNGIQWTPVYYDQSNEDSGTHAGWKKWMADITPFIIEGYADSIQIRFRNEVNMGSGDYIGVGQFFIYESDLPNKIGNIYLDQKIVDVQTVYDLPGYGTGTITFAANTAYQGNGVDVALLVTTDTIVFQERANIRDMFIYTYQSITTDAGYGMSMYRSVIAYAGTGTLFPNYDIGGITRLTECNIQMMASGGTIFDVSSFDPLAFFILDNVVIAGSLGYHVGKLERMNVLFRDIKAWYFLTGLSISEAISFDVQTLQTLGVNYSTSHLTITGETCGPSHIRVFSPIIQANETGLTLESSTDYDNVVITECVPAGYADNFFNTTVASSETFTAAAAYAGSGYGFTEMQESIDNPGVMSWRSGAFVPAIGQEITLSGFTTYTDYNVTGIITNSYSYNANVWFEIDKIEWQGEDLTGAASWDNTLLTIGTHSYVDGVQYGVVVNTDISSTDPVEYDGNFSMSKYWLNTTQVVINKSYTNTATGTFDVVPIDPTHPDSLAFLNPGVRESEYLIFGELTGNTSSTSIDIDTYGEIDLTGLTQNDITQRWKLIDDVAGVWMYLGNERFIGKFMQNMVCEKGATATRNYKWGVSIDGVAPTYSTSTGYDMELRGIKVPILVVMPISVTYGMTVQMMCAGVGTGTDFEILSAVVTTSK